MQNKSHLIILMHSKCINHSFERLPTNGVARNKHLFLHLILDTVLLAQQIMELLVFARINGSCWRSGGKSAALKESIPVEEIEISK